MIEEKRKPLLTVRNLKKYFPITGGLLRHTINYVRAVDGVSFDLYRGQCLGLVGESGSGKTTVARVILRALSPTDGSIVFDVNGDKVDLAKVDQNTLRTVRRHMQMIFQDSYSSLNPRMTILDIIGEPLLVNGMKNRREREERVRELLAQVGLRPEHLRHFPHAFSGGQRQRIDIARAVALHPKLIVADEPVSALDVSVQAQVLNLLQDLQERLELTYLLIAHNLSVVRHIADHIAVMYVGKLVELAETEEMFKNPRHPYTEALLSAMPVASPGVRSRRILLVGEVADQISPPPGCTFHPRCRYAVDHCRKVVPELRELTSGHYVQCHRAEELTLNGTD